MSKKKKIFILIALVVAAGAMFLTYKRMLVLRENDFLEGWGWAEANEVTDPALCDEQGRSASFVESCKDFVINGP